MQAAKQKNRGSRSGERKRIARGLLEDRDFVHLESWAKKQRDPLRTILTLLFDGDELVQWRSIEALGKVAPLEYEKDPERVRIAIRRILWLMNDESGGICWKGPEAIGEILSAVPALIKEYGPILPSFFIEEPFEKGSRWAVSRAAGFSPDIFSYAKQQLLDSLRDSDPGIRGYSLLALNALKVSIPPQTQANLKEDNAEVTIYDYENGQLKEIPISQLISNIS